MIIWAGIAIATGLLLAAIVSRLMAWRIESKARLREAVADLDTESLHPVEWQAARRLKRVALVTLVLGVFVAACIWALFGGAIADSLAR